MRKHSRVSEVSVEELSVLLRDEADVLREYLRDEQKISLHKSLKKLNVEYAKVLYLIYFEDFNITETATIIKKSYKQTENLVYRAKRALKSQLEMEGFVYEEL